MSASRLRIASQVWPPWVPVAMAGVDSLSSSIPLTALRSILYVSTSPKLQYSKPDYLLCPAAKPAFSHQYAFPSPRPQCQQIRRASSSTQTRGFAAKPLAQAQLVEERSEEPQARQQPPELKERPVFAFEAGVLGRCLTALWDSKSRPVTLCDASLPALVSSRDHIANSLTPYCAEHGTRLRQVRLAHKLEDAVRDAWMVIEAVPEDLHLKSKLLDRLIGRSRRTRLASREKRW